ncbi:MAG: hypothetical protein FJ206_15785 [Gemmatimonadetes bacterium]|nr:hypothetical protein [Gemmatimonadota bacterium]
MITWLVALAAAGASVTQPPGRAGGTVRRPAPDGGTIPVPAVRVVLHKVGRATQGPVDSAVTDPAGRFRFRFTGDSTASFLVSARFAGIEYFSTPLATNPARPDTAIALIVYDTSAAVAVGTRSRTLIVAAPDAVGARTVIDWLVISNRGRATRVGVDSLGGTWSAVLPIGARNPQLGDPRLSQISPEAVAFRGDSVVVTAPIAPGDKELLLQYELPASRPKLELDLAAIDSVDLFLEETATAAPPGWAVSDSQAFEGRRFRRLTKGQGAGPSLALRFPGMGLAPERVLPGLVGLVALGLTLLGWRLLSRPANQRVDDPVALADQIVAVDRQLEVPGADRDALMAERAGALSRLRDALAASDRRS